MVLIIFSIMVEPQAVYLQLIIKCGGGGGGGGDVEGCMIGRMRERCVIEWWV